MGYIHIHIDLLMSINRSRRIENEMIKVGMLSVLKLFSLFENKWEQKTSWSGNIGSRYMFLADERGR